MNNAQLGLTVRLRSGPAVIVETTNSYYVHVTDHRDRSATVTYASIKEYGEYLSVEEMLTHNHSKVRQLGKRFASLAREYKSQEKRLPEWLQQRLSF